MIQDRKELKEYLSIERPLYIDGGVLMTVKLWLLQDSNYLLWHYIKMLRYTEYYYNRGRKVLYWLYERRKNMEGARLGISIFQNSVGLEIFVSCMEIIALGIKETMIISMHRESGIMLN